MALNAISFLVCYVCFMVVFVYAIVSVPCNLVVTGWERADVLTLLCVMFSCVLSFSLMVSRVRCGT